MKLPNLESLEKKSFNSDELQSDFYENGYVILPEKIDKKSLELLTQCCIENIDFYASSYYISTIEIQNIEHRKIANKVFWEATNKIAEKYLHNYKQYYGGYGVKFSKETTLLNAHQDTTMVPYGSNRTGLTLWTPLMDVDEENGCVQIIPKSHRYNRLPRATGCDFAYKDYNKEIIEQMLPIKLKRGEVLIMDQSLIHYSGSNKSEYIRVAAMGMLKPTEVNIVCYHPIHNCEKLEVYKVPDDFYTYHMLTQKPENLSPEKIIENKHERHLWF
jgi:ectoine hydroxylase-related dioxygenase (phytanoyl-CoA dioxygenase family)